jgi:branched-chain amino acid transport system permease protein
MGLVYALIAAGLSLIFGLMEIVNFAHGEFLMLAMYVAFFAWTLGKLDPLVSLPLVALVLAALGWAVYHGIVRWVLDGPMLAQIFATFGLAVLLRSAAQFFFGVGPAVSNLDAQGTYVTFGRGARLITGPQPAAAHTWLQPRAEESRTEPPPTDQTRANPDS